MNGRIDTSYDMRADSSGKDPDSHSPTLRRYHQLLWSKPLPSGAMFDLDDRLHHQSSLGEFWLSSDSITHTYSYWAGPAQLLDVLARTPSDEVTAAYDLGCTVGAFIVFPLQAHAEGKWHWSINQARGTSARIRDRFDLTLECIRRHYQGQDHPLAENLRWYNDFFDLFGDFTGYVDFFLLNDLVSDDGRSVCFLAAFDDFQGEALPIGTVDEYREYLRRSMEFVNARNARIERWAN